MLQDLPGDYKQIDPDLLFTKSKTRPKTKDKEYILEITDECKLKIGYYPIVRIPCIYSPTNKFTNKYKFKINVSEKKEIDFDQKKHADKFRIYKKIASLANYQFYHGDCLDHLKNIPDKSIDVVVTSPPYNIGLKYNKYPDKKPRDQYLAWIYDIFVELKRILTDEGHIFLNMGYTNRDPWISMEVALKLKDLMILQNNITWVKSISVPKDTEDKKDTADTKEVVTHGHFKPINSKRYINVTNENIYHFTKTDDIAVDRLSVGVPYKYKCNLKSRKTGKIKADLRCKGNTWFIPYETIQNKKEKGYHPATFPEGLVEHCVRISGVKKGTILDPFVGSGTTVRVAQKLSQSEKDYELSAIGIDMDETYINYCKQQLEIASS